MLEQKFSFRLRFPYELLKNERREKKKKKKNKTVVASKQGCKLKQKWGVDKTPNTERSGTCRNIPEHEKIKITFMKKKINK